MPWNRSMMLKSGSNRGSVPLIGDTSRLSPGIQFVGSQPAAELCFVGDPARSGETCSEYWLGDHVWTVQGSHRVAKLALFRAIALAEPEGSTAPIPPIVTV